MASDSESSFSQLLHSRWQEPLGGKAAAYVGKFYACERIGDRITGKVEGNHGTYTVSIWASGDSINSTCSCYVGKGGYCHHCAALAHTFLKSPDDFKQVIPKEVEAISGMEDLPNYLKNTTLEKLLADLKAKGITQKAFAENIGMNPRHLAAVKSSEQRNHFFNELGAIKLACLWVLEHIDKK